jgi:hypothetical protein
MRWDSYWDDHADLLALIEDAHRDAQAEDQFQDYSGGDSLMYDADDMAESTHSGSIVPDDIFEGDELLYALFDLFSTEESDLHGPLALL